MKRKNIAAIRKSIVIKNFAVALSVTAALTTQILPVQASGSNNRASVQTESLDAKSREFYSLSSEDVDKLLDFVKEKWDAGELEGEDAIREAIEEGEEQFGIILQDSVKDQIVEGIEKLDTLGLDHDTVIDMAKKLYEEHGDKIADNFQKLYEEYGPALTDSVEKAVSGQLVEPAKEAAKAAVENTAKNFWKDLKDSVASFFENIFNG